MGEREDHEERGGAGDDGGCDEEQAAIEAVAERAAEGGAEDAGEGEADAADPSGEIVGCAEVSTDAAEEILHGKGGGGHEEDEESEEVAFLARGAEEVAAELAHGFSDGPRCALFAAGDEQRRGGKEDGQRDEERREVEGKVVDEPDGQAA